MSAELLHASAVLIGEQGVLVRGPPGSGKSSLLLALIAVDLGRNALVADDRVAVAEANGRLIATVPETIAGLIEVRGQGIQRRPFVSPAAIDLVVDLVDAEASPRLPAAEEKRTTLAGVSIPQLLLPVDCTDKTLRVGVALGVRQGEIHRFIS